MQAGTPNSWVPKPSQQGQGRRAGVSVKTTGKGQKEREGQENVFEKHVF